VIFEGLLVRLSTGVIAPLSGDGKILDVLASSVTGAIIGTGSSLAALALVSIKALALTDFTVADATAGALGVLVESSLSGRSINPRELEGTDAIRTIARVMGEAISPVVVALADIVSHASSVATAVIIAVGGRRGNDGSEESNSCEHFKI